MNEDYVVPPKKRVSIRQLAHEDRLQVDGGKAYFDIMKFFEILLPKIMPEFYLEATDDDSILEGAHARAYPDDSYIACRLDTYDGVRDNNPRDRMTLIHELGHLQMHKGVKATFARNFKKVERYRLAEWQAKAYAGEFLMCCDYLKGNESIQELMKKFGVSYDAASYQHRIFLREGILR